MRASPLSITLVAVCLLCLTVAQAKIYFHETFDTLDGWVQSSHKPDYGKVELSPGEIFVDKEAAKGMKLTEDAHFYAISKKLPIPFSNADDKSFVVSFSAKDEQDLSCGGRYLKFMADLDQKDFNGESKYWFMFGPDSCGGSKRVHAIFNYKDRNVEWSEYASPPSFGHLTHVFTFHLMPNNSYAYYLDGVLTNSGTLEDGWAFLAPREIADATDKQPDDWVTEAMIEDPKDTKPADWVEQPIVIPDPSATEPEDWDEEKSGKWVPPQIPNPDYEPWEPRRIANPAFKGHWKPRNVPNPDYVPDASLFKMPEPLKYVGVDVWQVESGTIFDNIIIGDDLNEVLDIVKKTYSSIADKERELVKTAEASKAEEISKGGDDDHDDGDEDDEGAL